MISYDVFLICVILCCSSNSGQTNSSGNVEEKNLTLEKYTVRLCEKKLKYIKYRSKGKTEDNINGKNEEATSIKVR